MRLILPHNNSYTGSASIAPAVSDTGLFRWYDYTDVSKMTFSGDNILTVIDKSPFANNLIKSGTSDIKYRTNGVGLPGRAWFGDGNSRLDSETTFNINTDEWTWYHVRRVPVLGYGDYTHFATSDGNSTRIGIHGPWSGWNFYWDFSTTSQRLQTVAADVKTKMTYIDWSRMILILVMRAKKNESNGQWLRINGSDWVTRRTPTATASQTGSKYRIYGMTGKEMYEDIIYNVAHDEATVKKRENYLMKKYGVI